MGNWRDKLLLIGLYSAFIVLGCAGLACLQVFFQFTDPLWARTINDTAHVLWGVLLTWAWIWLMRRNIFRVRTREADACLQRSGELLEQAQQTLERITAINSSGAVPKTEIDMEI